MSQTVSGGKQTQELARTMAGRVAGLVRPLKDTTTMVPRSDWTVGEHAAHLAFTKDLMTRMVAGEELAYGDGTRQGLARTNMETLVGYRERNGAVLAERIESAVDAFCREAAALPAGTVRNGPLGPMPVETFTAYLLTHLMMHGEAMARALRKPTILDRGSVIGGLPFVYFVFEHFLDQDAVRNFTAAYAVHMRGGPRFYVTFDDGLVRITDEPVRRVDCHISADPVAFFRVGIRLVEQWGPIARFQLTTWGPKPWLAFKFAGTFLPP
ncbi:MAG TPA: DinB family protein [Actinomycetota bacterium]|nr:DinB family protein [Actinomycetota bacterium]